MRSPDYPDTLLDEDTTYRLLEAIRAGVIDMAYFPGLYFRSCGQPVDPALVSDEEAERFNQIISRKRYNDGGQVALTRQQKIKLLSAIRQGRINLHRDFTELVRAYGQVAIDDSLISEEDLDFVLTIARRITN